MWPAETDVMVTSSLAAISAQPHPKPPKAHVMMPFTPEEIVLNSGLQNGKPESKKPEEPVMLGKAKSAVVIMKQCRSEST